MRQPSPAGGTQPDAPDSARTMPLVDNVDTQLASADARGDAGAPCTLAAVGDPRLACVCERAWPGVLPGCRLVAGRLVRPDREEKLRPKMVCAELWLGDVS